MTTQTPYLLSQRDTVSLKDIAQELDLSIGLVSKVLSGRMGTTGVSKAKREKIIATARSRGFTPNRNALALRSGQVGTIGLFLTHWGQPGSDISFRFLRGFSDSLAPTSHHLWLTILSEDDDLYRAVKLDELRRQADALVVAGARHPELIPYLEYIDKNIIPVITTEEDAAPSSLTNICIDTYQQGRLPTEHLIERGCRRIAQIAVMESRLRGYLDAMRDANLSTTNLIVRTENWKKEDGIRAVHQLLDAKIPFDGVVCQSDEQAIGVMEVLHSRSIRVPDQVKIIGVDDGPTCKLAPIPLSSVTTEPRKLGMETVAAVMQRLEGKKVPSRSIQPVLVQRGTT